jgi:hypothetical protein
MLPNLYLYKILTSTKSNLVIFALHFVHVNR